MARSAKQVAAQQKATIQSALVRKRLAAKAVAAKKLSAERAKKRSNIVKMAPGWVVHPGEDDYNPPDWRHTGPGRISD